MAKSHIGPATGIDAVTVLTWYLCVLLIVPAPLIVAPLGTAGAPGTVLAITAFFWWGWHHVHRDRPLEQGTQPVRIAMIAWLLTILLAYAHAMTGPLPGDEISPADSGLLRIVAMSGLVLVANDGIASFEGARKVVRRVVIAVGLVAILALVQYATRQLYVDQISIPGLTRTGGQSLATRSGLVRPSGTSTHPIEFGVMLTIALPLAIAMATGSARLRWLFRLLLPVISIAIFLSISRSAIICGAVGMVVLASSWSLAGRLRALAATLAMGAVVYLTVPGVLGTVGRLFTGISEDASVTSRTDSYGVAWLFVGDSPVLGRGFGTFLPKYWILDNGYLGLLIEAGAVGLVGLLALIVTAGVAARSASVKAMDAFDQQIARALLASLAAGASGLAFFDIFAFPQSAGYFFLVIGLCGAYRRLALSSRSTPHASAVTARDPLQAGRGKYE